MNHDFAAGWRSELERVENAVLRGEAKIVVGEGLVVGVDRDELLDRQGEQEMRLDQLKALVHQRRAINGDLGAH